MSRLNDIIRQVAKKDAQLARDLQRETDALADRRAFGLNFERHTPEAVELPGRPVRKNDKVHILPDRGENPKKENERLYRVTAIIVEENETWANIAAIDDPTEGWSVKVEDLVVVAEFRDPIYPGLVSTGKVERGDDKPFHTVINSENYYALQALLFTHRGKVDVIYIDPPYNSGARDWKYNNDYVESEDHYRHSKWLAMMERRLLLAKELLNPDDSVLIITIDEKEYLRLGLLLEQTLPDGRVQMISSVINRKGIARANQFTRTNEFLFVVMFGCARILPPRTEVDKVRWAGLQRSDIQSRRGSKKGGTSQFYPIFVSTEGRIVGIGDPIPPGVDRKTVQAPEGAFAAWPVRDDGTEMNWGLIPESLEARLAGGFVRAMPSKKEKGATIYYLTSGQIDDIKSGNLVVQGLDDAGAAMVSYTVGKASMPTTQWDLESHSAQDHGKEMIKHLLPGHSFDFPKSLYAVEDLVRLFVQDKPNAVVLDFFAGSGTTAHAVMRLNRQSGGQRRSISITNNEVGADEQTELREVGLRAGDREWEERGIFEHVTRPRIQASILGKTPEGQPVGGDYKFTDEFPMADGFEENVEFFTLTYESAMRVSSGREFTKIAPFLWLRAGSKGRRIDDISKGWDVADTYGVIVNLDLSEPFIKAVEAQEGLTQAFIVTDEDRLFEAMVRQLPEHVEPVRLYSSYLRNFEIEAGRTTR